MRIWYMVVSVLVYGLLAGLVQAETLEDWGSQQGRRIALPELIELISGNEVYDWKEELAPTFNQVARSVLAEVQSRPIKAERINEVGNAVELYVLQAFEEVGLVSGRPTPPSGRKNCRLPGSIRCA